VKGEAPEAKKEIDAPTSSGSPKRPKGAFSAMTARPAGSSMKRARIIHFAVEIIRRHDIGLDAERRGFLGQRLGESAYGNYVSSGIAAHTFCEKRRWAGTMASRPANHQVRTAAIIG